MSNRLQLTVPPEQSGQRIDKFLQEALPELSRSQAKVAGTGDGGAGRRTCRKERPPEIRSEAECSAAAGSAGGGGAGLGFCPSPADRAATAGDSVGHRL